MANFKTTIITKKGHALMAKLSANVATMKFTKVCSSDFDYSNLNNSELEQVVTFKNLKQTVLPDLIKVVNTTTVKVNATITNTNLTEGYYLRTIGLFALDPDEGEILYSITPTSEADYMAADNGITKSGISLDLLTTISNSENVNLEIDPNATISADTFYNVVGDVSALENEGSNLVDGINKNTTQLNEKMNKPIQITGSLNQVLTTGWYRINATDGLPTGYTSENDLFLLVINTDIGLHFLRYMLFDIRTNNIFIRNVYNGSFGDWEQLTTNKLITTTFSVSEGYTATLNVVKKDSIGRTIVDGIIKKTDGSLFSTTGAIQIGVLPSGFTPSTVLNQPIRSYRGNVNESSESTMIAVSNNGALVISNIVTNTVEVQFHLVFDTK